MQFVQVDSDGRPEPLDDEPDDEPLGSGAAVVFAPGPARKLLHIR